MKKVLLLLLFTGTTMAQVFKPDTSFRQDDVFKQYKVTYPTVNALLKDSLISISGRLNIYNNTPVASGNLLVDKNGTLLHQDTGVPFISASNALITQDGKYLYPSQNKDGYTLEKFNADGSHDSTFRFLRSNLFISQLHELHNSNIIVALVDLKNQNFSYRIIDRSGNLMRTFTLKDYGYDDSARINSIVFSDSGSHFFCIVQADRDGEIFRTDKDLIRDDTFAKILTDKNLFHPFNGKISVFKNALYVFQSAIGGIKNNITKYNINGTKLWQAEFNRVSTYSTLGEQFKHHDDESLSFISSDFTLIRINASGLVDPLFYQNPAQKGVAFLHAFSDEKYWIMRNESGVIERMNADGSIDPDFRLSLLLERQLYPNRIEKQTGNYLVEFLNLTNSTNSPFTVRYSTVGSCLRIYNQQHQLLYDFFDAKTSWRFDKTKDGFVVRGDGKLYTISNNNEIQVSVDTLKAEDIIDWDNGRVYRFLNNTKLVRYHLDGQLDESFSISNFNGYLLFNLQLLKSGKELLIRANDNSSMNLFLYRDEGIQERPFANFEMGLDPDFREGELQVKIVNGEYYVRRFNVGGVGNVTQKFLKLRNDYTLNNDYQGFRLFGGQFYRYSADGSIYINTASKVSPSLQAPYYNFVKILPSGKIDESFALADINEVFGFEFFSQDTLYVVGKNRMIRYVKSLETEYFNYTALTSKLPWNTAKTQKLVYQTNIKPISIEIAGKARLETDSTIIFLPETGFVDIRFKDKTGKILAQQQIELTKVVPSFTYIYPQIFTGASSYQFAAASTSGLPVKIRANGSESVNNITIDLSRGLAVEITMTSEGNAQYEAITETLVILFQTPLTSEPTLGFSYYPNPATEILYVETGGISVESFRLISTNGKEMPLIIEAQQNKYRLQLNNLPAGVYLLFSVGGNRQFRHKIIIE